MGVTYTTAAANTYVPIATTTLGSTQTSVTFSSIPSTYTDLVLVINAATASGTLSSRLQFNSDTSSSGTNYSTTWLVGNGTAASSSRNSADAGIMLDNGTNETTLTTNRICQIMNYSNTTTYKTVISRFNDAAKGTGATVGLWRSTVAISSVVIWASFLTETYSVGSTFSLYGIKAA
jgi:hypothetical protein